MINGVYTFGNNSQCTPVTGLRIAFLLLKIIKKLCILIIFCIITERIIKTDCKSRMIIASYKFC